jgi:hypothetical protein
MRIVTTPSFCSVCIEGLWLEMLKRISLIDAVETGCALKEHGVAKRFIELKLLSLAQFRENKVHAAKHSESYVIEWSKDGQALPEYENQTVIEVESSAMGSFSAEVRLVTDEVRVDKEGYLTAKTTVEVAGECVVGDGAV